MAISRCGRRSKKLLGHISPTHRRGEIWKEARPGYEPSKPVPGYSLPSKALPLKGSITSPKKYHQLGPSVQIQEPSVCVCVGGSSHSNHTCLPCHFFFDCIWMNVIYVRSGTSHMPLMYRDIMCMLLMVCTKFTIASFVISYTLQLRSFEELSQGPTTAAAPLGPISSETPPLRCLPCVYFWSW